VIALTGGQIRGLFVDDEVVIIRAKHTSRAGERGRQVRKLVHGRSCSIR
jgi:hypothetical protein